VTEYAAPFGLVRSRAVTGQGRAVRLALSVSLLRRGEWAPGVPAPQHIAFSTDDLVSTARSLRAAGAPLLPVPANYHDDLAARLDLDPDLLAAIRECGLFYDEDAHGRYLQLSTQVLGSRVFFEVVQRIDGYDGYGSVNAPVRMAAQRRLRTATG
jgi:4-hydroxyphenylpyruvate dioxygenase